MSASSRLLFVSVAAPAITLAYLCEQSLGTPGLAVAAFAVPAAVPRLRDAALPGLLAALLVVPGLNVVFAAALVLVRGTASRAPAPLLVRLTTGSLLASAVAGIVLSVALAVAFSQLSAGLLRESWVILGVLTCLGLFSALVFSAHERRGLGGCVAAGITAVFAASVVVIAIAPEGAPWIVVGLPVTLGLGIAGAVLGYLLQACRCAPAGTKGPWSAR